MLQRRSVCVETGYVHRRNAGAPRRRGALRVGAGFLRPAVPWKAKAVVAGESLIRTGSSPSRMCS
eukprot:1664235-Lingulodinium_polyedra.AAC.1